MTKTLRTIALCTMVFTAIAAAAQAKKPTLMVVPGQTWCAAHGYTQTYNNQGRTVTVPDYEAAIQNDMDLVNVITKIGELMAERGFPLKDLSSSISSIDRNNAEDAMVTSSTSGATMAETPLDRLLNRAKADILLEITWKVNTVGPKKSVTYNLRGIDAYSNKQIAAAQGTGPQSFSSEEPVLLEEAVLENMDQFVSQLQAHFDDLVANGREITMNVRIFDNGSGLSFEDEYSGVELTDIIDEWMAQNTVNHRYSLTDASEALMRFEQVRIPLYRTNGMAMDTRHFARELTKYLKSAPFNITCKIITKGLGHADVILGEK